MTFMLRASCQIFTSGSETDASPFDRMLHNTFRYGLRNVRMLFLNGSKIVRLIRVYPTFQMPSKKKLTTFKSVSLAGNRYHCMRLFTEL